MTQNLCRNVAESKLSRLGGNTRRLGREDIDRCFADCPDFPEHYTLTFSGIQECPCTGTCPHMDPNTSFVVPFNELSWCNFFDIIEGQYRIEMGFASGGQQPSIVVLLHVWGSGVLTPDCECYDTEATVAFESAWFGQLGQCPPDTLTLQNGNVCYEDQLGGTHRGFYGGSVTCIAGP